MIYITNRRNQNDFLIHHGIKGQKWGVRRFQNEDGSLTPAGRERYGYGDGRKESAREALDNNGSRYSNPVDYIKAITQDCLSTSTGFDMKRDPSIRKRLDNAAELGVKALKLHGADLGYDTYMMDSEDHESLKDWFLWEDQTIGLPMIADLVNQGYTTKQINKLIDICESKEKDWYRMHADEKPENEQASIAMFEVNYGNYKNLLKKFAQECERVKKGG